MNVATKHNLSPSLMPCIVWTLSCSSSRSSTGSLGQGGRYCDGLEPLALCRWGQDAGALKSLFSDNERLMGLMPGARCTSRVKSGTL